MSERPHPPAPQQEPDEYSTSSVLPSPEIPVQINMGITGYRPELHDLSTGELVQPDNSDDPSVQQILTQNAPAMLERIQNLQTHAEKTNRHVTAKLILGGALLLVGTAVEAHRDFQDIHKLTDLIHRHLPHHDEEQ